MIRLSWENHIINGLMKSISHSYSKLSSGPRLGLFVIWSSVMLINIQLGKMPGVNTLEEKLHTPLGIKPAGLISSKSNHFFLERPGVSMKWWWWWQCFLSVQTVRNEKADSNTTF